MPNPIATATAQVRHLQLARAVLAAVTALLITFSADHSAAVGLGVFCGFAVTTGFIELLGGIGIYARGARWPMVAIGIVTVAAGLVAGVSALRSTTTFFVVVIVWAVVTGALEIVAGARARRDRRVERSDARDSLVVGVVTLLLALGLAVVPAGFSLDYAPEPGRTFTLTGVAIAVGVFGAYAAIVAVYLGIAGFSPRRPVDAASGPNVAHSAREETS